MSTVGISDQRRHCQQSFRNEKVCSCQEHPRPGRAGEYAQLRKAKGKEKSAGSETLET